MSDSIQGASPILLLEWQKPVVGYEGLYEVSNVGNVRGLDGRADLASCRQIPTSSTSARRAFYLQNLVATAFIGLCPTGFEVNHINAYKVKNWLSNLEYLTHQDNTRHAVQNGLQPIGLFGKKRYYVANTPTILLDGGAE